jgi:3,4-dihydroxy 2-butanone 4-phosphate synthase
LSIDAALKSLRAGNFVLVNDASERENEVDMVIAAEAVEPNHVATMRRDAGGLMCVALHSKIADNLGLPYLTEIYEAAKSNYNVLSVTRPDDIPYDEHSAFSITVNHRRTYTGITDVDRALTIKELGKLGAKAMNTPMVQEFGKNFRSPGHVPILRAANGLILKRQGHTELVVALAEMAKITPVVAICEMLDAETNLALSWSKAVEYAREKKLQCLKAGEIIEVYAKRRLAL